MQEKRAVKENEIVENQSKEYYCFEEKIYLNCSEAKSAFLYLNVYNRKVKLNL